MTAKFAYIAKTRIFLDPAAFRAAKTLGGIDSGRSRQKVHCKPYVSDSGWIDIENPGGLERRECTCVEQEEY